MKSHILIILWILSCAFTAKAQILNPVSWTFEQQHVEGNIHELFFKASIDDGWAVYSQHIEDGPVPTSFNYEGEVNHFDLIGDNQESGSLRKEGMEPLFGVNVIKFYHDAIFKQRIKISDYSKPISGYLEFMTCNEESCLPPKGVDFSFVLSPGSNEDQKTDLVQTVPAEQADGNTQPAVFKDGESSTQSSEEAIPSPTFESFEDLSLDKQENILDPVKWEYHVHKIESNLYEFKATASVEKGFNIYSKDQIEGPGPTEFFWESDDIELTGELVESAENRSKGYDPVFDEDVIKIKTRGEWTQQFIAKNMKARVKGYVSYTACDDETCTFHDKTFDLDLLGNASASIPALPENAEVVNSNIESLKETFVTPLGDCGEKKESKDSLVWIFILGFLGGLIAILTPCVFPMIPLTVSFFTKGSTDRKSGIRNGLIYGASIIVIYVTIGLLITAMFGATALNMLSTNWIANSIFFLIFIVFAFSFFGFYEITLPSSWSTKSDTMAERGGLIGTFFMAFTLALVSFSCTGPIIGSAIVESATNKIGPMVVMLGFSTALALPFGLFAAFPAWLNSLPKSGGWMNSVKVILGFLELAFAFKFLSVADMTSHWGFLRYELFLVIWIIIAALMAIYLFGGIKFPHDSPKVKLSIPRIAFALAAVAMTIYFATGFKADQRTQTYNSLGLVSGIVPPPHYNFFKPLPAPDATIKAKYPSFDKCANNLDCFKDYYEALAYAKEVNKPVFLDFTGYGCVNCRKVEDQIWVKDRVWKLLASDYVMASLYVDDRKKLDEVVYSSTTGEKMRDVGDLWADFQIANFKQNSQPLYVLVTPDQKVLSLPKTYIPSEGSKEYAEYLECGLNQFDKHYSKEVVGAQ